MHAIFIYFYQNVRIWCDNKKLSGNINVVHVFKTNNLNEVEKYVNSILHSKHYFGNREFFSNITLNQIQKLIYICNNLAILNLTIKFQNINIKIYQ